MKKFNQARVNGGQKNAVYATLTMAHWIYEMLAWTWQTDGVLFDRLMDYTTTAVNGGDEKRYLPFFPYRHYQQHIDLPALTKLNISQWNLKLNDCKSTVTEQPDKFNKHDS